MILFEFFLYLIWMIVIYCFPSIQHNINTALFDFGLPVLVSILAIPIIGIALTFTVKESNKKMLIAIQFVVLTLYSFVISLLAHLIGELSILTGIALSCTPVLGFVLLHRKVAIYALVLNLVLFIAMLYLVNTQIIKDAVFVSQLPFTPNLFWNLSFFYLCAIKLLILFFVMDMMLVSIKSDDKRIKHLSEKDHLTACFKRSVVIEKAIHYLDMHTNKSVMSIIMLDIDNFKKFNDDYNHTVGDQVLQQVASALKTIVNNQGSVGRYGGEEFIIFLPECSLGKSLSLSEELRQAISSIKINGVQQAITASFGVASSKAITAPKHILGSEQLTYFVLTHADNAMYVAKKTGKNKVVSMLDLQYEGKTN